MDIAFSYDQLNYGERASTPTPSNQTPGTAESTNTKSTTNSSSTAAENETQASPPQRTNLQEEFQETFRAFSNSTWGTALGGFWGNVRKQGETYYTEARKEVGDLGADALKELEGLRSKVVAARSRSNTVKPGDNDSTGGTASSTTVEAAQKQGGGGEGTDNEKGTSVAGGSGERTLEENESFIAKFKLEAARRLKDVQKAEDAADEALERFGTNIRNFLRDAVSVSAPEPSHHGQSTEVLFESKDALTGKRVIHSSRMDAQLHVIHTTSGSFTEDPKDVEWESFKTKFDIEKKTEEIAKDLEKYTELRSAMEKLVPEKVEYKDFWTRYYFLRHVIEKQEEKRREMLKAAHDDEEVGWDEDSDTESSPKDAKSTDKSTLGSHKPNDSTSTLQQEDVADHTAAKTDSPRRSHDEKSVADSEASYDLVSGATSRAPGSPKEAKTKDDDSDDDDWE